MAEVAGIVQQGLWGWGADASKQCPVKESLQASFWQETHTHTKYTFWRPGRAKSWPPPPWHGQSSLVGTGPLLRKGPFPLLAGEMLTGGPEGPGFMRDWI